MEKPAADLDGHRNRSMPENAVIPVLYYPSAREAAAWLCRVLGFQERLRIGDHRVQLLTPGGAGAVVAASGSSRTGGDNHPTHSIMVRVADVDAHYAQVLASGAAAADPPITFPFGERQYSVVDIGGHEWTFSQTVADVDPQTWGGEMADL